MSPIRRSLATREVIQALKRDNFFHAGGKGGHRIYRNEAGRQVTISYHSSGATIPIGTLKQIVRQAGWSEEDLQRLGIASEN